MHIQLGFYVLPKYFNNSNSSSGEIRQQRIDTHTLCQTHLEIYEYGGATALGRLLQYVPRDTDHLPISDESEEAKIVRAGAFDCVFGLEHFIPLTTNNNEQLNR